MPLHDVVSRWWKGDLGSAGAALDAVTAPAELLYRGAINVRNALYDNGTLESTKLSVPVISVGNVAVGGTGKTPVTAWLARALKDKGARPAVLHGGYAADEPALHRELNADVHVGVGRDRVATGRAAIAKGVNVLVLDDAFQHRRLQRDLDIVLIAAESWEGPHRTLPRGPWREHSDSLRRAHWIVVTRRTASLDQARAVARDLGRVADKVAIISLDASQWSLDGAPAEAPAESALLVAGIANPEAFGANARAAGATVSDCIYFADHHAYAAGDAATILARAHRAPIVTTAKDWVKLRSLMPAGQVWVLAQRVMPEDRADELEAAALELCT